MIQWDLGSLGHLLSLLWLFFFFGRVGYQANFIPFGLDQLLEAPSSSLALFIHWVIWADSLGKLIIQIIFAVYICDLKSRIASTTANGHAIGYVSLILTALNFFVILSLKYCDFYSESGRQNPYKVVYKILNFVRKHKYPFQCSAFTYCDDELPSRIDFAKERFGGPFTIEQVEDMKTLLRILLVFLLFLALCLSWMFQLQILFPFYLEFMSVENSPLHLTTLVLLDSFYLRRDPCNTLFR